jgi:hypothetical protein
MKTNLFRKNHLSPKWGMRIMRLALLLLPLLGRGLGGGCVLFAQNGVAVSGLTVDAGTVTFNVSWEKSMPVALWSDTVWVFVDYNKNGVMERLPVTDATTSAGTVTKIPDNDKGVWIVGNARSAGNFSATVRLLTTVNSIGGACAYASNYPPVGEYSSDAPMLSFTGTPMYDIQLAKPGGGSVTVKSGDTFLLPCNYTVTSFTDATGALGLLNGTPFNGSIPQYAASTRTWTVGNQVWSDVINDPKCDHDAFTNSNTDPYCRSYTSGTNTWYYYNWPYVNKNQDALCSGQWRVPTKDDFIVLDKEFGGNGENREGADPSWVTSTYIERWGAAWHGWASGSSVGLLNSAIHFRSITESSETGAYYLLVYSSGKVWPQRPDCKYCGFVVRCVK